MKLLRFTSLGLRASFLAALLLSTLNPQLSTCFAQGSLTPPGAPAPTMKTLQQIEPRIDLQNAPASAVDTTNAAYHFIINQPGSYYLSANLGVTKTNGIQINAAGITLDLNGFEISRTSGTGGNGIEIPTTSHRASIRNGSVKGFANGVESLYSNLFFPRYPQAGAFRDLAVSSCTNQGIHAGVSAVLDACRAHDNSGTTGIQAESGSTLMNCTASSNTANFGISADEASLTNCSVYNNTGICGISASYSSLTNCTAAHNTGNYGINVVGSSLTNCSAVANILSAATSAGILANEGCTITHCTAWANLNNVPSPTAGMGFYLDGRDNTIQGCTASDNSGDGINIYSNTVARDNTCMRNNVTSGGGAGIHVTGNRNRIENNTAALNTRGFWVEGIGNLVIRNAARENSSNNYEIVMGNKVGVTVLPPDSAAVTGNTGGAGVGTTDPWANVSY